MERGVTAVTDDCPTASEDDAMSQSICGECRYCFKFAATQKQMGRALWLFPFIVRSPENYFFGGAMVSFAALATRNFTTVLALILMASPVCGLRPMRALRSAFTRRPMPGITKTPFFLVSLMAVSASRSRKAAACLLVSSCFSAMCRVRAVLVIPVAMRFFSFLARPWGRLCCLLLPGFPTRFANRNEG